MRRKNKVTNQRKRKKMMKKMTNPKNLKRSPVMMKLRKKNKPKRMKRKLYVKSMRGLGKVAIWRANRLELTEKKGKLRQTKKSKTMQQD